MADPSFNYSYTPNIDHRESNLYVEEYYSSTDTKIYFDDEEQTQIGYISYEIQEQLKPVYGYNSRTFDDVVVGNRIVTGQFTVPIKNRNENDLPYELQMPEENTDTIEIYNQNEEKGLIEDTDWFGNTKRTVENKNNANVDSDILVKLIALGYNLTANSTEAEYTGAIKSFQSSKMGDGSATGVLNSLTKQKINEEFNKLGCEELHIDGTTGYSDIGLTKNPIVLFSDSVLVLNKWNSENETIALIVTSSGDKYYISI